MSLSHDRKLRVGVVGAGIVGLCTALHLQQSGGSVVLFEENVPGEGCSFGNAALIAPSLLPFASPSMLGRLPSLLLARKSSVTVNWASSPGLLGWGVQFLLACNRRRYYGGAARLHSLGAKAISAYRRLLGEEFEKHFRPGGYLIVFENETQAIRSHSEAQVRRRLGANVDMLSSADARRLEPRLSKSIHSALHMKDAFYVADPLALSRAILTKFLYAGGKVVHSKVMSIESGRTDAYIVHDQGRCAAKVVVLAAGAATRDLAATAGIRLPIVSEWGYHAMLHALRPPLRIPIMSSAGGFVLTPLSTGTRLAGLADFAADERVPGYDRLAPALRAATRLIPEIDPRPLSYWAGARPSTPDSLPIIGAAPNNPNLMIASGHGHAGLTLGAVTAETVFQHISAAVRSRDVA